MTIAIIILCVLLGLMLLWILMLGCRNGHEAWKTLRQYRYAHRGLHDKPQIPENSLAAFQRAVDRGFGAELDVHLMKDGKLAVIHDSNLKRVAGADVCIEDLTAEDLKDYPLEESSETIPLLDQVLELFEGKTPLIIEIKVAGNNAAPLFETLARRLDSYKGDYCVESFDPRAVLWFKKHRPQTCRGQLAENFFRSGDNHLPWIMKRIGTDLLTSFLTRPDFIAYKFEDRNGLSLRLLRRLRRPTEVSWTIRTQKDLEQAEKEGKLVIFEKFVPEA